MYTLRKFHVAIFKDLIFILESPNKYLIVPTNQNVKADAQIRISI